MSWRKLLPVLCLALAGLCAFTAAPTFAQSVPSDSGPVMARSIVVAGAPRSYIVVSVPVPAEFDGSAQVSYQIETANSFVLVGRTAGTFRERNTNRAVLLTLGIPARARAGRIVGAQVTFSAANVSTVQVPVEIDVAPVHRISLATQDLASVHVGTRISLIYSIRNEGNTPDTVRLRLTLPAGWHAPDSQRELPIPLEPGALVENTVRISVPRASATGDFFIHLEASAPHGRATGTSVVEVVTGPSGLLAGPSFSASVAAVAGGGADAASLFSAELSGPLTSTMRVDGRFALASTDEPVATRGFSRVNVFTATPFLSIWSPDWRVAAGNTAVGFSDLTGTNAWGNAVSASLNYRAHSISGIAAPRADFNEGTEMYGGRYSARAGRVTVSGSAMRLSEESFSARELSAAGLGLGLDSLPLGTALNGEIAYRNFAQGTGTGYSAELRNELAGGRMQMRYLHAPGGSAAFARARDEFSANLSRRLLPRWDVSGSYFIASDSNATLAAMHSRALALNQQYHVDAAVTVSVDARVSSFAADAPVANAAFGSDERIITSGATVRRGALTYSGELGVESVRRTTDLEDGLTSDVRGVRGLIRTSTELATPNGVLQAETGYQHGAANNMLPSLLTLAARVGQLRLTLPPGDVFLNGEALYQSFGMARNANVILRGGLTVPLPNAVELSAHAEYNTFFESASARSPLVFSLKLERGVNLPRLRVSSSSGYVFQDLNNNGVRELDEPGVGNVVVRQGSARAVTGRDGRYNFWDRARGSLTVENNSLPAGFVLSRNATAHGDVALVPTANVLVTLVANLENTRNRAADLVRIVVVARDQQGREWLARRVAATSAIFDALPPGDYTLEFDFRGLPEPLRTQSPVSFRVDGRSTVRIEVPLSGRPIRLFQPSGDRSNRESGK